MTGRVPLGSRASSARAWPGFCWENPTRSRPSFRSASPWSSKTQATGPCHVAARESGKATSWTPQVFTAGAGPHLPKPLTAGGGGASRWSPGCLGQALRPQRPPCGTGLITLPEGSGPSGPQSSDPRRRSLAGPPSAPRGPCGYAWQRKLARRGHVYSQTGEGTRGGEVGVSPLKLGSEDGALPIPCQVPAPRPRFQALKAIKSLNRQNPRRQALWSPHRTDGEPRHQRSVWPRHRRGLKLAAGGAGGRRNPGSWCGSSIRGLASCRLGDPRGLRCWPRTAAPV